jgi:AhpD family alkylhydroperoxidase
MAAMTAVETHLKRCGLDARLMELVKLRVSQINGCAYCVDLHGAAALALGETERRLRHLAAWRESRLFEPSERAALGWAETLTRLPDTAAPDAEYAAARAAFDPAALVDLTVLIGPINAWNRLAVGFRYEHPA